MTFSSIDPMKRILCHEYEDSYSGMGCGAMVMRDGGGDQCGHPYREHWRPWHWRGQWFHSADPAGQDFDFTPEWWPQPAYSRPNPILVAFREREDIRNIYAVKQWLNFTTNWDGSICDATVQEIRHARRVFSRLIRLRETSTPIVPETYNFRGTLTEEGPTIICPAPNVVALVASDNTTIDMTLEQAHKLGTRMAKLGCN